MAEIIRRSRDGRAASATGPCQTQNHTNGIGTDMRNLFSIIKFATIIVQLLVVISLFALCWLPLNVYHLVSDVGASESATRHNSTAFLVCHWLAMSSVCYNPFVYCWLNANFRDAVKTCGRLCMRSIWFRKSRKQQPSIIMHNTTAVHQGLLNDSQPISTICTTMSMAYHPLSLSLSLFNISNLSRTQSPLPTPRLSADARRTRSNPSSSSISNSWRTTRLQ